MRVVFTRNNLRTASNVLSQAYADDEMQYLLGAKEVYSFHKNIRVQFELFPSESELSVEVSPRQYYLLKEASLWSVETWANSTRGPSLSIIDVPGLLALLETYALPMAVEEADERAAVAGE